MSDQAVAMNITWRDRLRWKFERLVRFLSPSRFFWKFVNWRLLKYDCNSIRHTKRELLIAGYEPLNVKQEDGPNKWIQENLLCLMALFSMQGHSGFSASYCISAFTKLADFNILSPLTGEDDEWGEPSWDSIQNIRCSRVFKDKDGKAYDIRGMVWKEKDGSCYTNKHSHTPVTFPYVPKTEYRPASEDPSKQ